MKAKRSTRSAIVDHLTGLYNRRHFDWCLKKSISEAKRKKDHFSLLMIDIDKFKDVNDKHGHLSGDKTLNDLAKILKKSVRRVDICFRYGGDEIAVILPDAEKEAAEHIAERLKSRVEKHRFAIEDGHRLSLKLSIGLAIFPDDGQKPKVLIKRADELLYKVKRRKKSTKKKVIESFILETKLVPPVLKEKAIIRPRLVSLLKENLNKKLILITANAGYGKTTLLAQVCVEFDKPYMFYDLDGSDNDLATFFNYIVTGIQRHYADFGERTRGILGQTRNIEILVGTFINEFVEKIKDEFYIILDDYHHLQQNKEITNALEYLLQHLPINLHIIISSRSIPRLNLAYYFAKQELFRFEKKHLQFNLKEIQLLLKETYRLNIAKGEIERIEKHSEGWITAIQLILQKISVSGEQKTKETLNGYIASGEEVFNYFANEVFESQPKKTQEFLMKTSILDEICNEACNYLLKTKDAGRILKYLETGHMFISKNDNYVYKYHPIFRDFLRTELKKRFTAKQISTLHNRIAVFFEKKNFIELAITHYLHSQEIQIVIRLVLKNIASYMNSGRIGIVENWLSSIPEKYYYKYPQLYIYQGHLFRIKGLWMEARQTLNKAKSIIQHSKSKTNLAKVMFELSTIFCIQGDMVKARRELMSVKKVCKRLDPELKLAISNCMAIIMHNQGKYEESKKYLQAGIKECEKYKKYDKLSGLICNLGVLYSEKGDFNKAEKYYIEAIKLIEEGFSWLDMPLAYENLAAIKIIKGKYEEALILLKKGIGLAEQYQNQYSLCYMHLRFGDLYKNLGKHTESLEYFNKAIGISTDLNLQNILIETQCAIGDLYVNKEDIKTAKEYFISAQRLAGKKYNSNIPLSLLNGKIKLAEKNYKNAERIFKKILFYTQKYNLNYITCRCYLFLATIYEKTKKNGKLIRCLKAAVRLSELWDYQYLLQKKLSGSLSEIAQKNGIELQYFSKEPKGRIKKSIVSRVLQITFFGNLIIKYNDKPIKHREFTEKAKKLLCYLILHRDQRLTKEKIIEQLWPECEIRKGEGRFYTTLHFMRDALTTEKRKAYQRDIILYKNKSYILNPDITINTDIAEFEGLFNQAKIAYSNSEGKKALSLLNRAIDIYRAPFCEGWYDNWVEEKRQIYENLYLKALSLLTEINFTNGLYEECVGFSQKYLLVDKFNEEINRKLILSLLNLGARQQAIVHYENFCKIFGKLNIEPTEKTIALRKQLYS